jgi:integrase
MRGRVSRRGKTWFYVVDVGQDVNGKRRQRWQGGFTTRRAAEEALSGLVGDVRESAYVAPSKQRLGEYLDDWLKSSAIRVRPSTLASYRMNMERHVMPALGSWRLQALTEAQLDGLYSGLLARGLSPRTVRYIHTIVHKALSDAVRKHRISRNVADLATPPSARAARAPEMKSWTRDELACFLSHVQRDRLYAAWLLLATTGMRRGEVLGLRWPDLDFSASRLRIERALIAVQHEVSFSEPKSEKGRRMLSLDSTTLSALRAHRARQNEERLAWGTAYQDQGLVFARENGTPPHPDWFSKRFDKLARAAGLPDIRVHDLRHTYASVALQAGIHVKVVSDRLGHSNVALTLNTYSHVIPALQEDAAEKVAALIFGR